MPVRPTETYCGFASAPSARRSGQASGLVIWLSFGAFRRGRNSIIGRYMVETGPSRLHASGLGLAYGTGNLGKFIGPAGRALITRSSNLVSPQATIAVLVPTMNYFAACSVLGIVAVLFIGFETRGRTIKEIDSLLTAKGRSQRRSWRPRPRRFSETEAAPRDAIALCARPRFLVCSVSAVSVHLTRWRRSRAQYPPYRSRRM
jgi:Sugar (and other) transporter